MWAAKVTIDYVVVRKDVADDYVFEDEDEMETSDAH